MDIVVIANGIAANQGEPNISGGDVRFLEMIRRWKQWGHCIHLMSTKGGLELTKRFGIDVDHFYPLAIEQELGTLAYIKRVWASGKIPKELRSFKGVIYTATEHIYDSIPAYKMKSQHNVWGAVLHFVSPPPWQRKSPGWLNASLFYLQQRMGIYKIKKRADIVFTVSEPTTTEYLKLGGNKTNTETVLCGIDMSWLTDTIEPADQTQAFDGVFMKRLHPGKGIFDLIEIWKEVVKHKPDAKLAVLGEGDEKTKKEIHDLVEKYHLQQSITFFGPVYNIEEKKSILRKSRLFLLPSHEENWAIVIGEAMACRLPVLCYDLPLITPVWQNSVDWVPLFNTHAFAERILFFLENEREREKLAQTGASFVEQFDWDQIAKKELDLLLNKQKM